MLLHPLDDVKPDVLVPESGLALAAKFSDKKKVFSEMFICKDAQIRVAVSTTCLRTNGIVPESLRGSVPPLAACG